MHAILALKQPNSKPSQTKTREEKKKPTSTASGDKAEQSNDPATRNDGRSCYTRVQSRHRKQKTKPQQQRSGNSLTEAGDEFEIQREGKPRKGKERGGGGKRRRNFGGGYRHM